MDICRYFESIHHAILEDILRCKIKDRFILELCAKIIAKGGDGAKGLPIGNLTSQFFANVYLDILDHHVKENLRVGHYLRYMDDFCLFAKEKGRLKDLRDVLETYLKKRLDLTVKVRATMLNTATYGLPFLGVRIFPSVIRVKRANFKRSYRKLQKREAEYRKGLIDDRQYDCSVQSLVSHLRYWNSKALMRTIITGTESKAARTA